MTLQEDLLNPVSIVMLVFFTLIGAYIVFYLYPVTSEKTAEMKAEEEYIKNADCTQLLDFINEEIRTDKHYQSAYNMANKLYEVNCK
jgi:hypothetical protein